MKRATILYLTKEQEKILSGEQGEAKRVAMEVLVKFGESVNAERLVRIESAHILAHYSSLHDAGVELMERLASLNARFSVFTTSDPASIDLERWKEFGIPEDYAERQLRLRDSFARMGGIECWSCAQYQVCNFPSKGSILSWAESSSVVFANSLLGCKTNKVTFGLDVSSAVTGLTPYYGMLIDENRTAGIFFRLKTEIRNELDYRSIGYLIGKTSGDRIPAIMLPKSVTSDDLKHLGAAAASSGPVTMIHYIGITPGSETLEQATSGQSVETVDIERSDIEEVEDELNQTSEKPDLVAIGVPHLSINEVSNIAKKVSGKKLKNDVSFYVYVSKQVYRMAERYGLMEEIEKTGIRLTHSTDAEISPLSMLGFNVVLTNSAKMAEIVSSEGEIKMRYASLDEIVKEVMD